MLKKSEILKLVNDYIGVSAGYLGDFSYNSHREFYPYYCDLDINPDDYEGSTRNRFIKILESSDPITQSKIIKGILTKYPISYFAEEEREKKQLLVEEFELVINRLNSIDSIKTGVEGEVKNLIFASNANSLKPEIVISDSISNKIEIVENADSCLVYDLPIPENGLTWENLIQWWSKKYNFPYPDLTTEQKLLTRLEESLSLDSPPEKLLFKAYFDLRPNFGSNFPALVPQVYLHYDPKTLKELKGKRRLERQRMDFLILFSNNARVVIEVDGKQHYAIDDTASPKKYAEMVAADRKLKLAGYQLYRFGGYELRNENEGRRIVQEFFTQLLEKHGIRTMYS